MRKGRKEGGGKGRERERRRRRSNGLLSFLILRRFKVGLRERCDNV